MKTSEHNRCLALKPAVKTLLNEDYQQVQETEITLTGLTQTNPAKFVV